MKQPYRWVNTNFQDVVIPQLFNYENSTKLNELFFLDYPQNKLNIQYNNNKYYMSSNNYLFLKLLFNGSDDTSFGINNYMIASTIDSSTIYYDTIFYNKNPLNLNIFNKNNNLSNITTLININGIPAEKKYITLNRSIEFSDKPINGLKSLRIQLILPNGELFLQNENHYINIIIYEKINVLKDTLLNTKDNTTTTTGIASIYDI